MNDVFISKRFFVDKRQFEYVLKRDVPMEIVSKLLGHSKITITQSQYAEVIQKKVSEEIGKLNSKKKGHD